MKIETILEPKDMGCAENCTFCGTPTRLWDNVTKQTPICESCTEKVNKLINNQIEADTKDIIKVVNEKIDTTNTDYALQQFIGFIEGKGRGNVIDLSESMGLTKSEWEIIRNDVVMSNFNIKSELDNYFNIK